ncbi:MAG: formimidoylglutamase [Bacteroidales bacterium]|nr:formimidoylglutamase [Bacteroidales bacterium]MCF6342280.1 formimidoylglutamase [Bacteroidales bacterium]
MDIRIYFEAVELEDLTNNDPTTNSRLDNTVRIFSGANNFPDLEGVQLAVFGVNEDRAALDNKGCALAPSAIRAHFYSLFSHWNNVEIADLGNIISGHTIDDTYFAIKDVVAYLLKNDIVPIIIGGSQDVTYANYLAYENIGRVVNIAAVDPIFDLGHDEHELNSRSYLSRIILHQPNFLFSFTNIGYQTYFVNPDAVVLMKNLFFDVNRLGNVKANMEEAEPMVRNADILSIDVSAIKHAEAPGNAYAYPNGFSGEELCRICRYAGMSDKLTSIGFYEYNPVFDDNKLTANLVAEMMWYFIDGFANRQGDRPELDKENYIRFIVKSDEFNEELVFLKSKKTDRWWMEVSSNNAVNKKYRRHQFVPCSYPDYQAAMQHEIPDRWWKVQQKLM